MQDQRTSLQSMSFHGAPHPLSLVEVFGVNVSTGTWQKERLSLSTGPSEMSNKARALVCVNATGCTEESRMKQTENQPYCFFRISSIGSLRSAI